MTNKPEIKTDAWGKQIWVPTDYPFVVRIKRQSNIPANHGWVVNTLPEKFITIEEAEAVANRPLGRGEMTRTVYEAENAETWTKNGQWKKRFERKRGGIIKRWK